MRDLEALHAELRAAGAWVFVAGLHAPSTATVVRFQDGDVFTTDGPYAEGKEHIGGFIVIRAADLDSALEWGGKAQPGDDPADRGASVAGHLTLSAKTGPVGSAFAACPHPNRWALPPRSSGD